MLPPDLTHRPVRLDEAGAVTALIAAQDVADIGHADVEEADVVGDWQRPSFDLATGTVGIFDDDRLVGYGERTRPERAVAAVHPDHRGRGIGTWIAHWLQDTARAAGDDIIGNPVPADSAGDHLLESLGYHVRWTSWVLQLPLGTEVAPRPLPAGHAVRAAAPEEYPAVHQVIEDAFLEWAGRERESYDDFAAVSVQRPGFEPWQLRVVVDGDGAVVAGCLALQWEPPGQATETFVARVAVRADRRGEGLAQALLVDTFATGRAHGATASALSTDSRTGALGLYERIGMRVTSTWLHRAVRLS